MSDTVKNTERGRANKLCPFCSSDKGDSRIYRRREKIDYWYIDVKKTNLKSNKQLKAVTELRGDFTRKPQ